MSDKPKFTPGAWEWEREPDGRATLYADRGPERHGMNLLGRMEPDANGEANLNLIAAAPDLYAALERALAMIEMEWGAETETYQIGAAALRKARGEPH